jgi:hypothetical protein
MVDAGPDPDPAGLDGGDGADVDGRRPAGLAQLLQRRHRRRAHAEAAQVADAQVARQAGDGVAPARRQSGQGDRGQLGRATQDVAADDVHR